MGRRGQIFMTKLRRTTEKYRQNDMVGVFAVFGGLRIILILNQPIDRYDSYNFTTLRQAPLSGGSLSAVAFQGPRSDLIELIQSVDFVYRTIRN